MTNSSRRWIVLAVGIVANICQGVAYTSSIFMLPLGEALARPKEVWSAEWGFIFGMCLVFLPAGMILSGKLADSGRTGLTIGIGAALYGAGLILAGRGGSVAWIGMTLGAMTSVGSGFVYGTVIGSIVRWFPDRRGLASGLAVAAVGVGPLILAPLTSSLIALYGVLSMFVILGVVCLVLMGLAALYVRNPPEGYRPDGWTPPVASGAPGSASVSTSAREQLDWKAMVRRPLFWLLFAAYFCGVFAGILVNGLAAPIAIELAGFTPAEAPAAVMLFAAMSAGGRALWGFLSDRFGRVFMIALAFVLTALSMFAMYAFVTVPGAFLPCIAAAGLCYGGVFGTFPSLCADSFGTKHAAVNLAVLFISFSLVAILAPQVVGTYRAAGAENFPKAFLVAGCVAVAGLVLSIIMGRIVRRAV